MSYADAQCMKRSATKTAMQAMAATVGSPPPMKLRITAAARPIAALATLLVA